MSAPEPLGVDPYASDLQAVGDRRRLGCWARSRGHVLETTSPEECRVVVVNPLSDLSYWSQWRLRQSNRKLLFDFVDFRYLQDAFERQNDPAATLRGAGRNFVYSEGIGRFPWPSYGLRLRRLLRQADHVTCPTPEHARFLSGKGIPATAILDCQEEIPVLTTEVRPFSPTLRLLWEGQLATLGHVTELRSALQSATVRGAVELTICTEARGYRFGNRLGAITARELVEDLWDLDGLRIRLVPWSVANLAQEAAQADAAIIPISRRDSAAWLKPENRAIILWRLGLPVLMSNTPAYSRLAEVAGVDGIASAIDDWAAVLLKARDSEWRYQQAARGQQFALTQAHPEVIHARWDQVLTQLGVTC